MARGRRLKKFERRVLKPSRQQATEVKTLQKRAVGSHHRWTAMATYPGRTPLAAVLLLAAHEVGET